MIKRTILSALLAFNVSASGFLPEPIVTNDPDGNIDPGRMYEVACEVVDKRIDNGKELEDVNGGIVIWGTEDQAGFIYYYYLQDVIDICLVMRTYITEEN